MNPDRLAELEEERTFLLGSLADLEREHAAGDVSDDDYATLRDDYTARAATVLRQIESGRTAPVRIPRQGGFRRLLPAIALTVLLGGFAGWLLVRSTTERNPGDTITGGLPAETGTDVPSLMAKARAAITDDPLVAIQLYSQVLEQQPDNVEALTYRGWSALFPAFQIEPGPERDVLVASADTFLTKAVATDPTYLDAQCFTAILRFRFQGDAAAAKAPYERCTSGDLPSSVGAFVEALGSQIDEALATASTSAATPTTAGG